MPMLVDNRNLKLVNSKKLKPTQPKVLNPKPMMKVMQIHPWFSSLPSLLNKTACP